MSTITKEKALERIKQMVKEMGSQTAVAKELNISPAYLGDILKGNRDISNQVAAKLGYKRVISYEEE